MIKFLTEILTLKIKTMTKHKDKKSEAPEVVKTEIIIENGIVETLQTDNNGEVSQTLEFEKDFPEQIVTEFDGEKFSLDIMNAFISSTESLKIMKKQFSFDSQHFVSINIEENERLLKIIESMKPQQ